MSNDISSAIAEKNNSLLTPASFAASARDFSRSPLGIIALFIVLVYAVAALVFGLAIKSLVAFDAHLLVFFMVIFPVIVLSVFTLLVVKYHQNLYAPSDFTDQKLFLELQREIKANRRDLDILKEVSPVAIPPAATKLQPLRTSELGKMTGRRIVESWKADSDLAIASDDPQKGKWGGKREDETKHRAVRAGRIRPLKTDRDWYKIALQVVSTAPKGHPLTGKVRFHLHDSFDPSVEEVEAVNNIAMLNIVAWGAFTVGVECDDGTRLEIDLSEADIDAPKEFKDK